MPEKRTLTLERDHRRAQPNPVGALCCVIVPFDVAVLNPNKRNYRYPQADTRRRTRAKERAKIAWLNAGQPRVTVPVCVQPVIRRGRRLDDDNLVAALKPIRDILFVRAITPDDNPDWLTYLPVVQEPSPCWRDHEEILFVVYPREALP